MPKRTTDYTKPKLIAHLRALADTGKPWKEMQQHELTRITCIGEVPAPHPEYPASRRSRSM